MMSETKLEETLTDGQFHFGCLTPPYSMDRNIKCR